MYRERELEPRSCGTNKFSTLVHTELWDFKESVFLIATY